MNSMRILSDNAIARATPSATNTNATYPASNLLTTRKSDVWRSTGTSTQLTATWPSLENLSCVALPFCNLSPMATMRVRLTSEGQITNLLQCSEHFEDAAWTKNLAYVTPGATTAPDGTWNGALLTSGNFGNDFIVRSPTVANGVQVVFSLFVKNKDATSSVLMVRGTSTAYQIVLNWSGSTLTSVGPYSGATGGTQGFDAVPDAPGWYRVWLFTATTEANQGVRIYPDGGNAGKSIYIWGAQLEGNSHTYGPELVTNGEFTTDLSGWSAPAGYQSTSVAIAGEMRVTPSVNSGGVMYSFPTEVGAVYELNFKCRMVEGVQSCYGAFVNSNGNDVAASSSASGATYVTRSKQYTATATTSYICMRVWVAGETAAFDSVSVRKVIFGPTSYYPSNDAFNARTGTATFIGSDGNIQTAASGAVRMQYNPDRLWELPKMLVEAAATNLVKGSETLAGWTGNPSVTATSTKFRGLTYQKVAKTTTATSESLNSGNIAAVSPGQVYTARIALRASTATIAGFGLYDTGGTAWGKTQDAVIAILSGPGTLAAPSQNGGLGQISNLSAGQDTVVQVTRLYTASGNMQFLLYPGGTGSVTSGDSILATYVQVESALLQSGSELVTNGTFNTDISGWTIGAAGLGSWDSSGKLSIIHNAGGTGTTAAQSISTVAGKTYTLVFDVATTAASIRVGSTSGGADLYPITTKNVGAGQMVTFVAAGATSWIQFNSTSSATATLLDNVSVKPVTLVPVSTSYIPTTSASVTRNADSWSSATATRPLGYIDNWQSYTYDSGVVAAAPAPAISLVGWTSAQAASAYAYGGGTIGRLWFNQMQCYGLSVDIADSNNAQGYLELAFLLAGAYWSPSFNPSSLTTGIVDTSVLYRTEGGDQIADSGILYKKMQFSLDCISSNDRAAFLNIIQNSKSVPVFVSVFPGSTDYTLERDYSIYGRRSQDSGIDVVNSLAYNTKVELESV